MGYYARNLVAWTYTDDAGQHWRIMAILAYVSQHQLGGTAASSALPPLPRGFTPRRLTLTGGTLGAYHKHSVVVYDLAAPILAPGHHVQLNWSGGSRGYDGYYNRHPVGRVAVIPERHPRAQLRRPA